MSLLLPVLMSHDKWIKGNRKPDLFNDFIESLRDMTIKIKDEYDGKIPPYVEKRRVQDDIGSLIENSLNQEARIVRAFLSFEASRGLGDIARIELSLENLMEAIEGGNGARLAFSKHLCKQLDESEKNDFIKMTGLDQDEAEYEWNLIIESEYFKNRNVQPKTKKIQEIQPPVEEIESIEEKVYQPAASPNMEPAEQETEQEQCNVTV